MHKSQVAFPSTISTKYFSNFQGTRDPSCLLPDELCFRSSSLQTPATHRTIDAVHSRVIDEGLNLRHLPARGIHGMFMNEVFLHFHLQLVTLHTSSDLWLNFLCFLFADFSWFCTRSQQRRKVVTWRTSRKKLGCSRFCTHRSSALSSSRLRSHVVPLALAVVKSTAKPSRSPNLVAHDANFDGLSIAVVSHAFNSFESMHNSMTSSSLRSSTIHSGLSDSSIFSNTSVLLCTKLFMDCSLASSKMFICWGAASAASPTTSSTLHVLCAGTSTSASRCCSSAFAANSSTSSPCHFWPRLPVNLTRFVSRSSVFVSLALEPTPDRFLSLMTHPLEL